MFLIIKELSLLIATLIEVSLNLRDQSKRYNNYATSKRFGAREQANLFPAVPQVETSTEQYASRHRMKH